MLAAQTVRVDNEAATMNTREFGEGDLLRFPSTHEYLITFVGIRRPGAGEFGSADAFGRHETQSHHAQKCHPSNRCHALFLYSRLQHINDRS
jgi:hypothetical protein